MTSKKFHVKFSGTKELNDLEPVIVLTKEPVLAVTSQTQNIGLAAV
jgi:hypothetical protein